jgi:Holliday junction DNA helicase RuvA
VVKAVYEYIKGIFVSMNKDYIVIENNGIGFKIFTSGSTIANMPKLDEIVQLYLQQIVREDFIGLYGFLTREELELFNLLLSISGVGAKASLSLLSISNVEKLKYAIAIGDEKHLTKAPGIGKKTAQRIILELKDKVKTESIISSIDEIGFNSKNNVTEALEALVSLGYSDKEAEQALKRVSKDDSLETIIKNCLKYLMN